VFTSNVDVESFRPYFVLASVQKISRPRLSWVTAPSLRRTRCLISLLETSSALGLEVGWVRRTFDVNGGEDVIHRRWETVLARLAAAVLVRLTALRFPSRTVRSERGRERRWDQLGKELKGILRASL